MQGNIVVLPYDENWKTEFDKIRGELAPALGDSVLAIEHVGSTSVPGLYAKPIIDIDIVIEEGMFAGVEQKLAQIGYLHVGDQEVAGREVFKYAEKQHLMKHHLYVCVKGTAELERHLALRDYLRTHDLDRDRYSEIKVEMARRYPSDIDAYIEGKGPFIREIYRKCGLSA